MEDLKLAYQGDIKKKNKKKIDFGYHFGKWLLFCFLFFGC